MKIQKILVPVDFSNFSKKALEFALFWGDEFGADITLIHVNTMFHKHFDREAFSREYLAIVEEQEAHIREWMSEHNHLMLQGSLELEVLEGASAANEILKYISTHEFDLVFMGTHGRTGAKHLLMGSVAEKVTRLSPAPVMTIHQDMENFKIDNILVPVDFSDYNKPLLSRAVEIAAIFDAKIHMLHVIEHPNFDSFQWFTEELKHYFEIDDEKIKALVAHMKSYVENPVDVDIEYAVIQTGQAYEEIVSYSKDNQIDLVMMATRGFSKFEYFWTFGSTTERVVRLAPCPVLAIRQDVLTESIPATEEMENY